MPEYLDSEIANEGLHAEAPIPGSWMDAPDLAGEEYQPDIEPPHVNDYAAFKKHKHYRQYFRPYRYQPFPAFMYHPSLGEKIVKSKEEVIALGSDWSPTPLKPRVDMTGKSLPVKSETQKLAETVANALAAKTGGGGTIDAAQIAAIVGAVVAAMPQQGAAPAPMAVQPSSSDVAMDPSEGHRQFLANDNPDNEINQGIERTALLDLAEREGVKVDKRWGNDRIKKELGL